jgi:magnesium transporter
MTKLAQDNLSDAVVKHVRQDFAALGVTQTVGEALESLRTQKLAEKIVYFYVVDNEQKLLGVVPTRRLLMSTVDCKIAEVMSSNVVSIPHSMSVLDALEFFVLYRLLAFPVVDDQNRLLGVIDVGVFTDEIFDVTERQSARDVFQLIGVRLDQARRGTPWAGFRYRFPWLLCSIAGGIACAFIAGRHEKFLDHVIVLALFIPVVLTLAEAVSMQSMTITLQALHERSINWKQFFRSLRIELMTSALLGIGCGGLVGLVALVWKREPAVALAIALSVWLAVVTACLLGVLLPTAVRGLKGDPKIASGPVVLAAADIATLLFYLNLSAAILGSGVRPLGTGVVLERRLSGDHHFTIARVDLRVARLSLFSKTPDGRPIGNFKNLQAQLERSGRRLIFATNAGIFTPGGVPLGLDIEDSKQIVPLNLNRGVGNFFLQPNGVFIVDARGARVIESSRFPASHPDIATQSGPMLVIGGQINPGFAPGSDNLQIRSGVGVVSDTDVVFAISQEPVNFFEFATVFRDALHCPSALYLDGAISRFFPGDPKVQGASREFGGILAVTEPG